MALKIHSIRIKIHPYADTAAGEGSEENAATGRFALLRPHFTETRSPSKSKPFAHASAARSAEGRSVKLIKAHLNK